MTSLFPISDLAIARSGGLQASVRLKRLPVRINAERGEKLLRLKHLRVTDIDSLLHLFVEAGRPRPAGRARRPSSIKLERLNASQGRGRPVHRSSHRPLHHHGGGIGQVEVKMKDVV